MKRSSLRSFQSLTRLSANRKTACNQSEGGYIIVVAGGMIVAMATMLLTAELVARVDANGTKSSGNSAAGFYAAEAGLNLRAKDIKTKFVGYNVPLGTSPNITTPSSPPCKGSNSGTGDFVCDNSLTVQDYLYPNDTTQRIPVSTYVVDQNIVSGVSKPTSVNIGPNEPFAGLNAQEYRYDVVSTAYDRANNPSASLGIRFKSRLVPLFQFFAFYEKDLDLSRPAPLTINGPMHTNGDMYLNAGGDVKLYGQLTSAGKMYRGAKVTAETCNHNSNGYSGKLWIKNAAGTLLEMACYGSPSGEITTDTTNKNRINVGGTYVNDWGGQILPKIPKLTLPSASLVDAKLPTTTNKYDYWNKADLRIALRLNNADEAPVSIEVVNADKTTNAAATATLNSSTCLPTANATTLAGTTYATTDGNTSIKPLTVGNGTIFKYGDALKISGPGVDDFDENVIASALDLSKLSSPASNLNPLPNNPLPGNTLILRRPLGKQAISSVSGVTVQKAIVWSSKTFYNYREKTLDTTSGRALKNTGRLIRMLNVDVKGIMSCAGSLMGKSIDDATEGGLVWHFTVIGPNSEVDVTDTTKTPVDSPNSYGIRLYNGDTLASTVAGAPSIKGLTIVSDQAMYIRGDYNSINKKPASLIADSINVLSNNSPLDDSYTCTDWSIFGTTSSKEYNASDCKGPVFLPASPATSGTGPSLPRPASTIDSATCTINVSTSNCTTINAAFLSGVDIPSATESSGGLNNYPRLHENWSNGFTNPAKLIYRGSMVSLGQPRKVNGKFGNVGDAYNIYFAPNRDWAYDTDFDNAANLPPLSPRFVYLRQERFSRDYTRTSFLPSFSPFGSFLSGNLFSILPNTMGSLLRF
jgi:hypothetical protein